MRLKQVAALGVAALMSAQLGVFAAGGFQTDFGTYNIGNLNGQDGWEVTTVTDKCYAEITEDPTDASNLAMHLFDSEGSTGVVRASRPIELLEGAETDGIVTAEFRINLYNPQTYQQEIQLRCGTKKILNLSSGYSSGTQFKTLHPAIGGKPGDKAVETFIGQASPGNWNNIRCVMDFNTETLDLYITRADMFPAEPTVADLPFVDAGCTGVDSFYTETKSWSKNADYYLDDIKVRDGIPGTFGVVAGSAAYSVQDGTATVSASLNMPVAGNESVAVIAVAYGANNKLLGMDASQQFTEKDLVDGTIAYTSTFAVDGQVSKVKLMLWDSLNNRFPYSAAVECAAN